MHRKIETFDRYASSGQICKRFSREEFSKTLIERAPIEHAIFPFRSATFCHLPTLSIRDSINHRPMAMG